MPKSNIYSKYLSEKKANHLFKRLNTLMGDMQQLIKESDEAIEVDKSGKKPERNPKFAYDDKRAVVLNLSKVTKATNRKKSVIIGEGERLHEIWKKVEKSNEFVVKNMVGDVTKIVNELKELANVDPSKLEEIEKVKKTFRFTVTGVANANKKIKEIEDKRRNLEREIINEKYFEELDKIEQEFYDKQEELRQKYNVDDPDTQKKIEDMDQKLSVEQEEIQQNASEIEKEAKEVIRSLRDLIKETYDIPDKIIDQITIYLKTMGAVANIARKKDSAFLTEEGIKKFFADKEFREFLEGGGWAKIQEQSDKVTIANAKMPDLGVYFAELKTQGEQILNNLDNKTEETASKKGIKTEGMFTDSIDTFISSIFDTAKVYFNRLKETFTGVFDKLRVDISEAEIALKDVTKDHNQIKKDLYKQHIDIQKSIKTFEINMLDELSKEVK